MKKAAELIERTVFEPADSKVLVEAQFKDVPAKAPRKRGKALPPHRVEKEEDRPVNRDGSA